MGPDGELWFAETGPTATDPANPGANNIGEISASGEINEFQIPGADSDPTGVVLGSDGNVWFTEAATGDVRKIKVGVGLSDPVQLSAANSMPSGIAGGGDANLWIVENTGDKIGLTVTAFERVSIGAGVRQI